MNYSIFGRSYADCAALADERGWGPKEWIGFILDIDEPFAKLRGVDEAA